MTQSPVTRRSGLTLVEILIAMVMTLIVLFAMMEAFKYASGEMQRSRAVIEMSNQLRAAQELLRSDLEHVTLDPKPWTQTALPKGYFEYVESKGNDKEPWEPLQSNDDQNVQPPNYPPPSNYDNYLGDVDDVLAFTVNRPEQPFRGRYDGNIIESPMAEVIWWTSWDDRNGNGSVDFDESVTLYRRVLLIRPDLNNPQTGHLGEPTNTDFLKYNDLSVRAEGGSWAANRLEDLGHRGARFAHNTGSFPHLLNRNLLDSYKMAANNQPTGDDVVLTNIAGFDVKVYSPDATIDEQDNLIIEPKDEGYSGSGTKKGAFVDLAHDRHTGWFSERPNSKSYLNNIKYGNILYDTWTPVYENDGLDQDGQYGVDQGTNGIDDGGTPAVDETAERETMPPYGHPIRGLKVSLRLVEKNTKQVRQASVIHSFVPE